LASSVCLIEYYGQTVTLLWIKDDLNDWQSAALWFDSQLFNGFGVHGLQLSQSLGFTGLRHMFTG